MHPVAKEMKIPTLKKGKGFAGPEAFGCCNTGTRPVIFHSKDGLYYVGAENDVDTLRCLIRGATIRELISAPPLPIDGFDFKSKTYRMSSNPKREARAFKSRGAAVGMFRRLVSERCQMNDELAREHAKAVTMSKSSDPETAIAGVLALSDF